MLIDFLRNLFFNIDMGIYAFASVLFQAIIDLANYPLFSNKTITSFANRIYLILGIVMVFKLIISFIQILINPDNLVDKEKGLGGILKRVIISLILIVMIRPIFNFARDLQTRLLPIIPKVILASKVDAFDNTESSNNNDQSDENSFTEIKDTNSSAGKLLAYYTFVSFFYPYSGCEAESNLGGVNPNGSIYTVGGIVEEVNKKGNCPESSDGYVHVYRMGISTLAGAFLVYVLVTIALKIAIRTIKLGLCEILAPIPIASYIDPKTSKQSFDKWVETSVKTYLDLFTRLATVYFVIYVFNLLLSKETGGFAGIMGRVDNDSTRALLVMLFIIVGLLYFAKEMPKFVTNLLGIPEGFSDIGDMFKGQGWRALGNLGATAAAAHRGALENWRSSKAAKESLGTNLRRAIGGYAGTARRGLVATSQDKGIKDVYNSYKSAHELSQSRINRKAIKKMLNDRHNNAIDLANNNYETAVENATNARNRAMEEFADYNGKSMSEVVRQMHQQNVNSAQSELANLNGQYNKTRNNYNNAVKEAAAAENYANNLYDRMIEANEQGDQEKFNVLHRQYLAAQQTQKELETRRDSLRQELDEINSKRTQAQANYDKLDYAYLKINDKTATAAKEKIELSRENAKRETGRIHSELSNVSDQEAIAMNRVRNANDQLAIARANGDTSAVQRYTEELQMAQRLQTELRHRRQDLEQQQQQINKQLQLDETEYNAVMNRTEAEVIADNYAQQYAEYKRKVKDIEAEYSQTIAEAETSRDVAIENAPKKVTPIRTAVSDAVLGKETLTASQLNEMVSSTSSIKNEALGQASKKAVEYADQLDSTLGGVKVKFSQVLDAKRDASLGRTEFIIKDENGNAMKDKDGNDLKISLANFDSVFVTLEKNAQVDYITKVDKGELYGKNADGSINYSKVLSDPLITKSTERFGALLDLIRQRDPATAAKLEVTFQSNPGKAIKDASDYAEGWAVEADRLSVIEQANNAVKQAGDKS